VYQKSGNDLVTVNPIAGQVPFTPGASGWRNESVNLSVVANQGLVKIKFVNESNFANNLYIDNINLQASLVSIEELGFNEGASLVSVFPNPASETLTINSEEKIAFYEIYSIYGQKVLSHAFNDNNGDVLIQELSSGTYFIQLISAKTGERFAVKFIKK